MGCRFAAWHAEELVEDGVSKLRTPLLDPTDSLFVVTARRALPATLMGVRPARHILLWEGYFLAADTLVDMCVADPRQALRLVYPILFSYRHAVEVALKFVLDFYDDADAPLTHDLLTLWSRVKCVFEYNCSASSGELESFEHIVHELAGADPSSTSFRYAWKRRSFGPEVYDAIDYPHDRADVELDLVVVRATMNRVQQFLDEMDSELMNCGFDPRD